MCTAMLYDPADHYEPKETTEYFEKKSKVYERLMKLKQVGFLKAFGKKDKQKKKSTKREKDILFFSLFNLFILRDSKSSQIKHNKKLVVIRRMAKTENRRRWLPDNCYCKRKNFLF